MFVLTLGAHGGRIKRHEVGAVGQGADVQRSHRVRVAGVLVHGIATLAQRCEQSVRNGLARTCM